MSRLKYPVFTEEMKKTHTILIPNMLPIHFKMISKVMNNHGYKVKLLETTGQKIVDEGLKSVHNDTCYPALLVIGQLIEAIESGKYEKDKVALMITQTGGGCRASNYIYLLRKALEKRGYSNIPVISLNFSGLDKEYSFKITLPMAFQLVYSVLLGDFIMLLYNQCKPYEATNGESENARLKSYEISSKLLKKGKLVSYGSVKNTYEKILEIFDGVNRKDEEKIKVGIVGEIYVKYSPLGNNDLESFLISVGCEVVVPGLLDFCLYCIKNSIIDHELYSKHPVKANLYGLIYNYVMKKQIDIIKIINRHGKFTPPQNFNDTYKNVTEYISPGVKMGEGWLLTAEMVELVHSGVNNVICTQPFGCLPNHIAGKGMLRKIKEKNPQANIVAIDYDPGATKINQENRIKLMLSVAKRENIILPAQNSESNLIPEIIGAAKEIVQNIVDSTHNVPSEVKAGK